ncbi:MAG: hypothetical protein K6D02_02845, partial [Lachnospiraceae bacterium]|nr:hypothetical protein [Lachnospiraceae bacterium]
MKMEYEEFIKTMSGGEYLYSLEEKINDKRLKCALCGKKIEKEYKIFKEGENAKEDKIKGLRYFHRGLSKEMFLCKNCSDIKVLLKNKYSDGRTEAEKKARKLCEKNSPEIKEIVEKWITNEDNNLFNTDNNLKYYVEGEDSYLFIYKNGLVHLRDYLAFNYDEEYKKYNNHSDSLYSTIFSA